MIYLRVIGWSIWFFLVVFIILPLMVPFILFQAHRASWGRAMYE